MQNHYTVSNLIDAKNFKQLKLIGALPNENIMYFFCREEKILFPVELTDIEITSDDLQKLVINLVNFFHASVDKIIINWRDETTYVSYVRIVKNKSFYDFVLNLSDALHLGIKFNVPIFISTQLLLNDGIKITREMLEDYLK